MRSGTCTRSYLAGSGPEAEPGWQCASTSGNICALSYWAFSTYEFTDTLSPGARITSLKVEMDGMSCDSDVQLYINGYAFGTTVSAVCFCGAGSCTTKTWTATNPAALAAYVPGGSNTLSWSKESYAVNIGVTVTSADNACEDCQGASGCLRGWTKATPHMLA
jgi:hypothetical protein